MKYDIDHEFVRISSQTATHRIILIHGWGADSDDLLTLGKEMTDKTNFDFEVISLRAPGLHPSGHGRQWYGLYPHDWNRAKIEVNKLLVTLKKLNTKQIPLTKTILLGFSQGAAMAIDVGFKLNLGLIVSCSGYPHPSWLPGEQCPPLILSHGLFDNVVPIGASRLIYEKVKNKSSKLCELVEFDGFHQIDSNLIDLISLRMANIF
ncbi:MAG: esterase [Prochlorococcus marinus CUG1438]|nr:esterase [Prochlorococcus marinus CUG1438]